MSGDGFSSEGLATGVAARTARPSSLPSHEAAAMASILTRPCLSAAAVLRRFT